jgi:hypothetical protein
MAIGTPGEDECEDTTTNRTIINFTINEHIPFTCYLQKKQPEYSDKIKRY